MDYTRWTRTAIGLGAASIAATVLLMTPIFLISPPSDASGAVSTTFLATVMIAFVIFPLGLAVHSVAARFTRGGLFPYAAGALLLGGACSVLALPAVLKSCCYMQQDIPLLLQMEIVGYGAATAMVSAVVFWLVRRPDRSLLPS